jgi:hypothetical protein
MGVKSLKWLNRVALAGILIMTVSHAATAVAMPSEFAGTWVLRAGGKNALVLRLKADEKSGDVGSLSTLTKFSFDPGVAGLTGLAGPPKTRKLIVHERNGETLMLDILQADPKASRDWIEFRLSGPSSGGVKFGGVTMNYLPLARTSSQPDEAVTVATDWDADETYAFGTAGASNPEMTKIYQADQSERGDTRTPSDTLRKNDEARRTRVKELLEQGRLASGADFENAAYVFQHGASADDYLLAHTLALIAMKKGRVGAVSIAAETLDRYLQKSGRPQIYGTQFIGDPKTHKWSQDPYQPSLISDALRRELGVETVDVQKEQLARYMKEEPLP